MIKFIVSVLTSLFLTGVAFAQLNVPAPSPAASFAQKFGLTEIKMNYSRPSASGRTIFGNIVPYGKIWRAGANDATTFTTTDSITVAGKGLPKGTYVVLAIPGKEEWSIIFNSDPAVGYDNYKSETNVLTVKVKPEKTAQLIETFNYQLTNIKPNACDLELAWEYTLVRLPLMNDVNTKVMAQIKQKLAGPTASEYQAIARYYLDNNGDLKSALEYTDKAIVLNEGYGNLRLKALLLAKMGNKKAAIEWAEKSAARAKKLGVDEYVRLNEASIAEWKAATQ